jgi:cysteine-rich repeat protein
MASIDNDGCSAICTIEAFCGDGILDSGEQCDDGNTIDNDGCSAICIIEPFCGDGIVDQGEACDDGNEVNGDGCENDCTLTDVCANSTIPNAPGNLQAIEVSSSQINLSWQQNSCNETGFHIWRYETSWSEIAVADPDTVSYSDTGLNPSTTYRYAVRAFNEAGNSGWSNVHSATTLPDNPICGNGILENGEACDDGNDINTDGCRNDCTLPACGDGIVDQGEACDDGNTNNSDSCRNDPE